MVSIPGGAWMPTFPPAWGTVTSAFATSDVALLDADEEEVQLFGIVRLAAGSGSKTFGTSGSKIGWWPGASITFADDGASDPTLRVGVKKSSTIDLASGPAARATIGQAAFDVYKDLIGGTDTITSTTYREDAMASGTPFTVSDGDLISVCFHLDKPGAAAQSIKVRSGNAGQWLFPISTLVTSGPTYTPAGSPPLVILIFDDTTIGWLEGSYIASNVSSETIGNTNLYGNIFRLPFNCTINGIAGLLVSGGTTNFDFGLFSDPLGTPAAMSGGVLSIDPQLMTTTRNVMYPLPEISITANTDYALAIRQNSATAITALWYDVNDASHFKANGLDSTCYAAKSTAGAAFASQNSGKRRASLFFRISQVLPS